MCGSSLGLQGPRPVLMITLSVILHFSTSGYASANITEKTLQDLTSCRNSLHRLQTAATAAAAAAAAAVPAAAAAPPPPATPVTLAIPPPPATEVPAATT